MILFIRTGDMALNESMKILPNVNNYFILYVNFLCVLYMYCFFTLCKLIILPEILIGTVQYVDPMLAQHGKYHRLTKILLY